MAELQVTLSESEQQFLGQLLQTTLNQTRVEEHRTRKPSYRERVIDREHVITDLLNKLGQLSH